MVALPKFAPSRMTVAEFLDWFGDDTNRKFELVDGEPRAMAPASGTHGTLQSNFARLLGNHLAGTGCRVVTAPGIVPRANAASNMRIPDLAVTCAANQPNERALPDPIIIIEILSPSNEAETRDNVWAYLSIPSVRHVLLVRSTGIAAELLTRQADSSWPAQPLLLGPTDRVALDGIDFGGALGDFYTDTHLARDTSA
jgi:Uma2 family endonuclease